MATVLSDIIEKFLLDNFGDDNFIDLSRNELALFFNCAPSQINYVLTTRFSPKRGYKIISQRGGGGFIRVSKINVEDENLLIYLCEDVIKSEISYLDAKNLLSDLVNKKIITLKESEFIDTTISPVALSNPFKTENYIRANILKNLMVHILSQGGEI